jgi:hypothetical protein
MVKPCKNDSCSPQLNPSPQHHPKEIAMLLLISHRYPRLGAMLSALSSVVFLIIGIASGHTWLIEFSAAGIALSAAQLVVRNRRAAHQAH